MKTFDRSSSDKTPVHFSVDGDKFEALPPHWVPGAAQIAYAEQVKSGELYQGLIDFLTRTLTSDSSKRFLERFDSSENPITMAQMLDVVTWLIGDVYGDGSSTAE